MLFTQFRRQCLPSLRERRRDGSLADATGGSDVRIRQIRYVPKEDEQPTTRRQAPNRLRQSGITLRVNQLRIKRALIQPRVRPFPTPLQGDTDSDPPNPCFKRPLTPIRVQVGERLSKTLLHDIVGNLITPDNRRKRATERRVPTPVHILNRSRLPDHEEESE